ncbi:hypothetical protein EV126DRAFT_406540 [Verticillium dahliae]|nr:hypothetical protein EV126DRAFT_406540 [Verticillium dahliae]
MKLWGVLVVIEVRLLADIYVSVCLSVCEWDACVLESVPLDRVGSRVGPGMPFLEWCRELHDCDSSRLRASRDVSMCPAVQRLQLHRRGVRICHHSMLVLATPECHIVMVLTRSYVRYHKTVSVNLSRSPVQSAWKTPDLSKERKERKKDPKKAHSTPGGGSLVPSHS